METGSVPPCFLRDALSNVSGVTIRRHRKVRSSKLKKKCQVDREKCTGCGACAAVCPNGAIHMEEGRPILDAEACVFCGKCTRFCPTGAREVIGQEYTVKELVKELMKDQMFYEESGGGVTLSGGEVMSMDMDYLLAVAKELKRQDVTLTIDTCGVCPL